MTADHRATTRRGLLVRFADEARRARGITLPWQQSGSTRPHTYARIPGQPGEAWFRNTGAPGTGAGRGVVMNGFLPMDRVTRIAAVSVETADLDRLRHLVDDLRNRVTGVLRWTESSEADVLFIAVDSIYGHMDWLKAQASGRRIISIADRAGNEHEVLLRRPFDAAALLAAIEAVQSAKKSASSTAAAPPAAAKRAATPTPTPTPARKSIGLTPPRTSAPTTAPTPKRAAPTPAALSAPASAPTPVAPEQPAVVMRTVAVEAARPAPAPVVPAAAEATELALADFCTVQALPRPSRLIRNDAPALTVDSAEGVYYGPPGLKGLEPYCRGLIARSEWEAVSPAVMEGLRAAGGGLPLSRLLWVNALYAGNGRLLGDADGSARVRMARWPQIEREYPKHFRIATAMMKGFATVAEIAAQSGATEAEVADLANAYLVTGFVEAEGVVVTPASSNEGGGLLARFGLRSRKS